MSILGFFKRLTSVSVPTPTSDGMAVSIPRTLSPSEEDALVKFNDLAFDHLPPDVRPSQQKAFSKLFLSGESFFAAMLSSQSPDCASTYLYTDINGAAEAAESCAAIGRDHGIATTFSSTFESGAVYEVIAAFDRWLQLHGRRFLQDTKVDWGYAGIVMKNENIDAIFDACTKLDIHLRLGCKQ